MLFRPFSSIVSALFFMATHGQSHSAELTEKSDISESLFLISNQEQAVQDFSDKELKEEKCIRVEKIKKEQHIFDNLLEKALPHVAILVMSTLAVYSPPLALFTCVLLMIFLSFLGV